MDLGCRNVHNLSSAMDRSVGRRRRRSPIPYDRILIAAAMPTVPEELLKSQLKDGGFAVLPVGSQQEQSLLLSERHGDQLKTSTLSGCRFCSAARSRGLARRTGEDEIVSVLMNEAVGESANDILSRPIEAITGIGPTRLKHFKSLGLTRLGDLLEYFPRDYQQERAEGTIDSLRPEEVQTARGTVVACDYITGGKITFRSDAR